MDFPKIKKEISLFLTSEEAKVLKKNIVKLGLTASVIAAIITQAQNAHAGKSHNDNHGDGHDDGHSDAVDHTDGMVHGDSHADAVDHDDGVFHTDSHTDGHADTHNDGVVCSHDDITVVGHSSVPAAYDTDSRAGGHSSNIAHTDHADFSCS